MPKHFFAIKDPQMERDLFKRRIFTVAIVIIFLMLCLLARLVYLQIYQHTLYTTLARQNQLNLLPLAPNRGLIYDRNGVLLADNVPVYNLEITPDRVESLETTLANLQKLLPSISDDDRQQFYRQLKMHRRFEPVVLHTRLTENEVATFAVEQYRFPGVSIHAEMIRHYPFGPAFAHVIGYVGRINVTELARVDPSNYSATNYIGKTGIEKYYEAELHGTVGFQQAETDASGQVIRVNNRTLPIPGNNLYLTIDSHLQIAAEQILGDQRGAIVAIQPQTGEVLAFVSNPSFDPNLFVAGINQKDYKDLENAPDKPLYNRALRGKYSPGSTIKPYIGLEALSSGIITPEFTIYDPGWFQLAGSSHIYHGYHHLVHGVVNMVKAITVSSDVYFYNVALKIGIGRISDMLTRFGFGQVPEIDLPGAAKGVVPSEEWKREVLHKSWYPGDTLNSGIGQGYTLVTPLQAASAVAALAMHGERWQPHVLLRMQTANGIQTAVTPQSLPPVVLQPDIWKTILTGMEGVVMAPEGTAHPYFEDIHYTAAGKTGTAQVFSLRGEHYNSAMLPLRLRDNSLFVVFAPAENPTIALAVVVQNSTTPAAKVARAVLDFYFGVNKNPVASDANATDKNKTPDTKTANKDKTATAADKNKTSDGDVDDDNTTTDDDADTQDADAAAATDANNADDADTNDDSN